MEEKPTATNVYHIYHSKINIVSEENTEQQAEAANENTSSSSTRNRSTKQKKRDTVQADSAYSKPPDFSCVSQAVRKDSEIRQHQSKTASPVQSPSEVPRGRGWVKLTDKIYLNKEMTLKRGTKVYEGRQKFGLVWRNVAIKLIPYDKDNYKEVDFLSTLDHPNVIRIFDADEFNDTLTSYIYIVMERCLCCLKDFISQNDKLDLELMLAYAKQLVRGVAFIHRNNILHRDLKLENVLISPSGDYIRVADFGLSKKLEYGRSVADISSPGLGTDGFRAPEMYKQNPVASFYSDSFSLGIMLHMMFSKGKHPCGSDRYRWRTSIMNKEKMHLDQICEFQEAFAHKRKQLLHLLKVVLDYDPKIRITPAKMLHHPFFADAPTHVPNQDFKRMSISNTGTDDLIRLSKEARIKQLEEKLKIPVAVIGYEKASKLLTEIQRLRGKRDVTLMLKLAECELHLDRGNQERVVAKLKKIMSETKSAADVRKMGIDEYNDGNYIRAMTLFRISHDLNGIDATISPDDKVEWIRDRMMDIKLIMKHLMSSADDDQSSIAINFGLKHMEDMINELREVNATPEANAVTEAACAVHLTLITGQLGEYEKTIKCGRTSSERFERCFGARRYHFKHYGMLMNNLAAAYKNTKRYSRAERHYVRALECYKQATDYDSEDMRRKHIATAEDNLGQIRKQ